MCDPVSASFAAISMIQAQQQQQDQAAAVNAQNALAVQNEEAQIASMNRDLIQLNKAQIDIAGADFESAEDAADAKLQLAIESNEAKSAITAMNFENLGGGGQTSDSILAAHKRGLMGSLNDVENNFMRGMKKRKGEWDNIDYKKQNRWYTAKSNILNLNRSGHQSQLSKGIGLVSAAGQGYSTGKSIQQVNSADPQTKVNTSDEGWTLFGTG